MSLKINIQKESGTNAVTKSVVVGSGKAITPTGSGIIEATNLLGTIDASQVSTGTLDPARLPLGLGTDTTPANGKLLIGNGVGYTAANLTAGTNISITNTAGGISISSTAPSGLVYQGTWNALTNVPPLTSSVGTQGYYYVVSVAGTTNLNGITDWQIGDWAIFNGSVWQKIDNSDQVTSVFGRQGAVAAASGDYTASQVTNVPYAGIVATDVQAAINELYDDIANVEQVLTAYVTNAESFSITRGQVVYLYGAQGDRASVKLASNLSDATSAKTFGVVADASIAAGAAGYIRCQGVVSNLNLGAYNPGDTLYLGATPGSLTATKPYAPNHLVYVGIVERANNGNGLLYVKIQNGYELDEIHDVQITAPRLAGQTLLYDQTNALWKNARLTAGTGMTLTFADASVTLTPNFAAPPVIGNTTPNVVNATTLNATDVAATNGTFLTAVTTPYVKADTGVYLTLAGGSSGASLVLGLGASGQATFDRKLNLTASTTTAASLNIPQGVAPTTPTNGDIWTTSTGVYARINGATVGPFGTGTVTSVSGTANQVTVSPTTGDVVVSLPTAITNVNSITASSATNLTLNGGSSGASIVAGQGTNANVTLTPSGTGSVTTPGILKTTNTTASTSTTSGALQVAGGVGVAGAIYGGSTAIFSGNVTVNSGGPNIRFDQFDANTARAFSATTIALQANNNSGSMVRLTNQIGNPSGSKTLLQIDSGTTKMTSAGNLLLDIYNATQDGSIFKIDVFGKISHGPQSYSQSSWTTTGALTTHGGATITDSSTLTSGTAASAVFHSWAVPTIAATNASVTTTDAATLYVAGGPTASTNQTITNSYGLWNAGKTRLDNTVLVGTGTNSSNGIIQLATHTTSAGGIGFGTDTSLYRSATGAGTLELNAASGSTSLLSFALAGTKKAQIGISASNSYFDYDGSLIFRAGVGGTTTLTLDSSQNATFSGKTTINGAYTSTTSAGLNISGMQIPAITLQSAAGTSRNFFIGSNYSSGTALSFAGSTTFGGAATSEMLTIDMNGFAVKLPQSTASTSTSTGALIVSGGVGVAGALYSGSNIISSGGTGTGTIGVGTANAILHTVSNAPRVSLVRSLSTANARVFDFINQSDGVVNFRFISDDGNSAATAISIVGSSSAVSYVSIPNTTDSSSTTTGALVVSGGAGFAKNIYSGGSLISLSKAGNNPAFKTTDGTIITKLQSQTVGDTAGVVGTESNNTFRIVTNNVAAVSFDTSQNATFASTTDSSSTTTGALVVSGGLGVAKNLYAAQFRTAAGSSTAPSYAFSGDTSSGLYSLGTKKLGVAVNANIAVAVQADVDGSTGPTVYIKDLATAPTVNPSGGGYLFSQNGALKWRGSSGTVTTIAAA